jgi:hypothetical protein
MAMGDPDDPDDPDELRRRLREAEVRLGLRRDPGAMPSGDGFFLLSRWEKLAVVAVVVLAAAGAVRW